MPHSLKKMNLALVSKYSYTLIIYCGINSNTHIYQQSRDKWERERSIASPEEGIPGFLSEQGEARRSKNRLRRGLLKPCASCIRLVGAKIASGEAHRNQASDDEVRSLRSRPHRGSTACYRFNRRRNRSEADKAFGGREASDICLQRAIGAPLIFVGGWWGLGCRSVLDD